MSIWLRIAGHAATEIAAHTPPTWETLADGGCGEASWAFALSPRAQHPALRVGSSTPPLVEVMCGALPVYSGLLSDYDRTTGECTAFGLHAAKFLALDSLGANTRTSETAISEAISRGWQVINSAPISGPVAGDATGNPLLIGALLDEYAEQLGQRWGVDGQRVLYMRADPTEPTWLASPDVTAFGTTNEDRANTLKGRYLDSTSGVNETASAGSGAPEQDVDLTEYGPLSLAAAEARLAGMLTRSAALTAWTNGTTLSRFQIQTKGGIPAFLPAVRAGQLMRSFGLSYATSALNLDTLIGKTRYTAGEDTIYIEPANTAPRNFVDVIAAS